MEHMEAGSGPRGTSIFLFVLTLTANGLHLITHAEVNLWIATVAGVLSIDHYVGFGIVRRGREKAKKIGNYFKRRL